MAERATHHPPPGYATPRGVERSVGCRALQSAERGRNGERNYQAEIRRIRPLPSLMGAVAGTRDSRADFEPIRIISRIYGYRHVTTHHRVYQKPV